MKLGLSARNRERGQRARSVKEAAFSMLEVVIACAIFFMVAFALLELVTRGLVAARSLQVREPDPGLILAQISLSNTLEEVELSGDFEDIAPKMYPGYQWRALITETGTNGLFEVLVFTHGAKKGGPSQTSGMFWRPNSKPGSATKGR